MKSLEELIKLHDKDQLIGKFEVKHEDYHKSPGVNSTFLIDSYEYSMAHAKYWKENPTTASKAMEEGTLFHTALLEPDLLHQKYNIVPTTDKRTKEGKAVWEQSKLDGKIPITQETLDKVLLIRKSLMSSQTGKALFENVSVEMSYYWRDKDSDVLCRAKADAVNEKLKILIDLKKIADGRIWNIKKSIQSYGYKIQSALYQDGINLALKNESVNSTVWVFVEADAPHGIRFVEVKKEWLEEGRQIYKETLEKYVKAINNGFFPGYDDSIISINEDLL